MNELLARINYLPLAADRQNKMSRISIHDEMNEVIDFQFNVNFQVGIQVQVAEAIKSQHFKVQFCA